MNQGMNHASSLSDYHNVYWIWMFTFASFIHHCLSLAGSLSQLRLGRRRFTPWTCCKFIIGLHLSTIVVLTSIAYKAKAWWSDYSVPTCTTRQQSNYNKKNNTMMQSSCSPLHPMPESVVIFKVLIYWERTGWSLGIQSPSSSIPGHRWGDGFGWVK